MSQIDVANLKKEYRIAQHKEGFLGGLQYLFCPQYHTTEAVKNISFSVERGERVAFVGMNGAGKSTTIKMLVGILQPSGGNVNISGRNPFYSREENTKKIGVVFGQKTQLWWDIPIIETFRMLKSIYEIPEEVYQKNMEYLKRELGLEEFIKQPARQLSLGQRVRADIAAALLLDPEILFLDEPTLGLDVAVKEKIYRILDQINREKKMTIFLTSHDIKDLVAVCDRIIILAKGEICFDDKIEELYRRYGRKDLDGIILEIYHKGLEI